MERIGFLPKGGEDMTNLSNMSNMCGCKYAKSFALLCSVDSTNNYLRRLNEVLPDGFAAIANEQHSGRGRQGKTFFSPADDGLYMSLIIKDKRVANDALFTAKASVAVCRAIEKLTGTVSTGIGIKWVNDIYFGNKKLCGILCERLTNSKGEPYVIAGFGINMRTDLSKYPKELRNTVCSLYDITKENYDKLVLCRLLCAELERVFSQECDDKQLLSEYKSRSIVLGREINVTRNDVTLRAAALDICPDGALLVRYEDGFTAKLCGGEISVRVRQ